MTMRPDSIPAPDFNGDPISDGGAPADAAVLLDTALTAAVRDVHGVTDVFAPGGSIAQLPQIVGALATGDPERLNRVRVVSGPESTTVVARIGIAHSASTPEAAREVADALLRAAPVGGDVTVSVQVSRIA